MNAAAAPAILVFEQPTEREDQERATEEEHEPDVRPVPNNDARGENATIKGYDAHRDVANRH